MTLKPAEINLASQPFRRERAQNAAIAAACGVLTCTLLLLVSLFLHERAQAGDLRSIHRRTKHQAACIATPTGTILRDPFQARKRGRVCHERVPERTDCTPRRKLDARVQRPGNGAAGEYARLLAMRLPQVGVEEGTGTNRVQLDMLVASERSDAVIGLLKNLELSPLFGAATVVTQTPPTQNDPFYKYRVTVAYAQKL